MTHPPWLRFQAYMVGLPKTGSTSLATVFGGFRAAHEWRMHELLNVAGRRARGTIDDERFWELTTPRLTRPSLEMDSATCHHLYADLLVQRFPKAVFVHSVRDVGGWLSSLLDMALRYQIARAAFGTQYTAEELWYMDLLTGGTYDVGADQRLGDAESIVPMMRYWAEHMHRMATVLPEQRTLVVRTTEIGDRLPDLARLCGVLPSSLRHDVAHSNKAAHRFDRLAGFASPQVRAAYDFYCADVMASLFPSEHAAICAWSPSQTSWDDHVAATEAWVTWAVAEYGEAITR